jgi:hypothetical protein
MAARSALSVCLVTSCLLVACSLQQNGLGVLGEGEDGGTLIGSPGASGGSGGAGGTGGPSVGGAAGAPMTGGSAGTAGAPGGSGGGPEGGAGGMSPVDAAVAPLPQDAAPMMPPPPAPDAPVVVPPPPSPPAPDAAVVVPPPPTTPGTIACGASQCVSSREYCCANASGSRCVARDALCTPGAARRCDGPEDCDGERVCCARAEAVGGYRSACVKLTECGQLGGVPVCRSGADCPAGTRTCSPVSFSGGTISTCQR